MAEAPVRPVVTSFLRRGGRVLLLLRAPDVRTYPGRWGAVSGTIEAGEEPITAARREIAEETGLDAEATLVAAGEPFRVEDPAIGRAFLVHSFLFDTDRGEPRLDAESERAEWLHAPAMLERSRVPELWESWRRVAPWAASIAADREHGAAWLSLRALEVLRDRAAELRLASMAPAPAAAELRTLARELCAAQPAMAVLRVRVDGLMHATAAAADGAGALLRAASAALDAAVAAEAAAARAAGALIAGRRVLTLSRSATVLAALRFALPPPAALVVAESLPGGEGAATATAARTLGIPTSLVRDDDVPAALDEQRVEMLLVGADAVLADGAVVNKTGTHATARAAAARAIARHAVATSDKVAPPAFAPALGTLFDATPAALWTSIVGERGPLARAEVAALAAEHARWANWREQPG